LIANANLEVVIRANYIPTEVKLGKINILVSIE